MHLRWMGLIFAMVGVIGCAVELDAEENERVEVSSHAIVGRQSDHSWVGVGVFISEDKSQRCVATLIRQRVILTAARCVRYADQTNAGVRSGTFQFGVKEGGDSSNFASERAVMRVRSMPGSNPGGAKVNQDRNDLAVGELDRPISDKDPDWAVPLDLADAVPGPDQSIELFGYGCATTNWDASRRAWTCKEDKIKRKASIPWQAMSSFEYVKDGGSSVLTGGGLDAAGPAIIANTSKIVALISPYTWAEWNKSNGGLVFAKNLFVDVISNRNWINRTADSF